jgi:hypothetical protein
MWGKFQARLTSDARYWYKLWSSWLAIAWGGLVYFFWSEPGTLSQVLSMVPSPYREHLGGVVGLLAAALPIIVRCLKQGNIPTSVAPVSAPIIAPQP